VLKSNRIPKTYKIGLKSNESQKLRDDFSIFISEISRVLCALRANNLGSRQGELRLCASQVHSHLAYNVNFKLNDLVMCMRGLCIV